MANRCILILLALIAFTQAVALRHKRQVVSDASSPAPITLPFPAMDVPCPVRCILGMAQAWTKTVSFELPSSNMVQEKLFLGDNDTYSLMCSLYASYGTCLRGCDASNSELNKAARDASPPLTQVCTDKQAEFDNTLPCLAKNTNLYQRVCQNENENALAAAVRMSMSPRLEQKSLNDYCSAANRQLFCLFPLIRQTCGDAPYDLIRSIANASFVSVRVSIGDTAITTYFPDCEAYLNTVGQGIPSTKATSDSNNTIPAVTATVSTPNTTTTELYTTTPALELDSNTTSLDNTTGAIRRDDANGVYEKDGERFDGSGAPQFQTTTPTSNAQRRCLNFLALLSFSLVFFIFV